MSTNCPVRLDGASVFYREVIGLSKVTLSLEAGITGIVGPNGSGKSTLMRVLAGLIDVAEGRAEVLGQAPFASEAVRRRIGLVPATECFFDGLSGRRNLEIAFLAQGHSGAEARRHAQEALELVGLTADGDRRHGTWSRGMRQRLKLGLVLASDVDVVLLDEPFLGVDPPSRKVLRVMIQDLGKAGRTVLVSSHVLHEVELLTDLVGILAHGRLLGFGTIDHLLEELRDRHPHRIRVETDVVRALAGALMQLEHISEIKIIGHDGIEFVTHSPQTIYRELPNLIRSSGAVVRRIETVDHDLHAVFRHITAAGAARL